MSGGDYRDRPSFHIPGKEFLVVIVVVFSSLSFTLGYFVGKSRRDLGAEQPVPVRVGVTASPREGVDAPGVQLPEENTGSAADTLPAGIQPPSKGNLQKGTISYTVQIGALSSEKDAEDFRAKYEKKGYKAYIVTAKNKRDETIYKIRIGEFKSRKDADLLSLKLRKTEGLTTFVTFKDE